MMASTNATQVEDIKVSEDLKQEIADLQQQLQKAQIELNIASNIVENAEIQGDEEKKELKENIETAK